jgi:hypothetical protein
MTTMTTMMVVKILPSPSGHTSVTPGERLINALDLHFPINHHSGSTHLKNTLRLLFLSRIDMAFTTSDSQGPNALYPPRSTIPDPEYTDETSSPTFSE